MRVKTKAALGDWQAEIERLSVTDDQSAMTILELSKATGRDRMWVGKYVQEELAAGRVKQTQKRIPRGRGTVTVTAYVRV
jgi:hypothetical protein